MLRTELEFLAEDVPFDLSLIVDEYRGLLADALLNLQDLETTYQVLRAARLQADSHPWLWRSCGRYWIALNRWRRSTQNGSTIQPFGRRFKVTSIL